MMAPRVGSTVLLRIERFLAFLVGVACFCACAAHLFFERSGSDPRVHDTQSEAFRLYPLEYEARPPAIPERKGEIESLLRKAFPVAQGRPRPIHEMLHALRLWGRAFQEPGCMSSREMLDVLLDSGHYARYYGEVRDGYPLLAATSAGFLVRVQGGRESAGTAPHHDKFFQVMGELGLPSSTPVLVQNRAMILGDGIREMLLRFNLLQELEFSTVALAHYLPPRTNWQNRHGETISFDEIASTLIRQDKGACFNIHRLFALVILLRADEQYTVMGELGKTAVERELTRVSGLLAKSARQNGLWDADWISPIPSRERRAPIMECVTATGHHLEWIAFARETLRPPASVVRQAADGLIRALTELNRDAIDMQYGPTTHAVRGLALLAGANPREFVLPNGGY